MKIKITLVTICSLLILSLQSLYGQLSLEPRLTGAVGPRLTPVPYERFVQAPQNGGGYGLAVETFTSSKTSIPRGTMDATVRILLRNASSVTFPAGHIGVVAVGADGTIARVISTIRWSQMNAGVRKSQNITISNTMVPAGQYRLMLAARPEGGEWKIITDSVNNAPVSIDITVGRTYTQTEMSETELRVVELYNYERAQRGIPPLIPHENLAYAARLFCEDIIWHGISYHTGIDGSNALMRARWTGVLNLRFTGENIASNPLSSIQTPEEVVNGWMNSPGHRDAILNESFTHVGAGFFRRSTGDGQGRYSNTWATVFGTFQ